MMRRGPCRVPPTSGLRVAILSSVRQIDGLRPTTGTEAEGYGAGGGCCRSGPGIRNE